MAKKERREDRSGSGLVEVGIDTEKLIFSVDFTGKETHEVYDIETGGQKTITSNYFNSETVLFYVSNSYYLAYRAIYKHLLQKVEEYKTNKSNINTHLVVRHILPYYFNYRHYVETQLKALSVAVKRIAILENHDLKELLKDVLNGIQNLSLTSKGIKLKSEEELEKYKKILIQHFEKLTPLLEEYLNIEPSPEYYRYIFEKDFKCNNPKIYLDLKYTEKLFEDIVNCFKAIGRDLFDVMYFWHLV